jgi:hypothetical protein
MDGVSPGIETLIEERLADQFSAVDRFSLHSAATPPAVEAFGAAQHDTVAGPATSGSRDVGPSVSRSSSVSVN